jgi:hypothetical protein
VRQTHVISTCLVSIEIAADYGRMTAHTETILGQMSRCGKYLESFTLTHCWGTSALDDGLKTLGFEVLARACRGLRIGVRADLNAIILVGTGGDDECGKFFLLQGLSEGHGPGIETGNPSAARGETGWKGR